MPRDIDYLVDMLQAAQLVVSGTEGISKEDFFNDWMREAAILYEIQIVGEASKRLSETFRNDHPEIPWRAIAGMRNIIVHAYNAVDDDEVWQVVSRHSGDDRCNSAAYSSRREKRALAAFRAAFVFSRGAYNLRASCPSPAAHYSCSCPRLPSSS